MTDWEAKHNADKALNRMLSERLDRIANLPSGSGVVKVEPKRNAVIIDVRERGQLTFSIECKDDAMRAELEALARTMMDLHVKEDAFKRLTQD